MLYNIKGILTVCDVNYIVVECGGIGFKCFTSLNTAKSIGKIGDTVNVFTYLSVRDDALDLYGFSKPEELQAFKLLISVSGVGPKAALSILSELSCDRLAVCVASGDAKSITAAQGVGNKTAQRIVLELKDKMGFVSSEASDAVISAAAAESNSTRSEAVEALVALGFSQTDASVAVGRMDSSLTVDEMIRLGLKQLASNL